VRDHSCFCGARIFPDEPVITEDMRAIVESAGLGFAATTCHDGSPNLSPKGSIRVHDDRHLVFANIASPGTIANPPPRPARRN